MTTPRDEGPRRDPQRRLRRLGHPAPGQPHRAGRARRGDRPGGDGHRPQPRGARGHGLRRAAESSPNDMVVALRLEDDAEVAGALAAVDAALAPVRPSAGSSEVAPPRTTSLGPAAYGPRRGRAGVGAGRERHGRGDGRDRGRPRRDDLQRQRPGRARRSRSRRTPPSSGVLVMGPDCGTAVIGGVGLGFANAVRPRAGRPRRRLRHRLPAAARPARPRRWDVRRRRRAVGPRRRRARPVVRRRRSRHPRGPAPPRRRPRRGARRRGLQAARSRGRRRR